MANPTLLDMPIARDGNKNAIPTTDNGTTGLLSQQYGWQLINAIPPQQGGKAVKREDFNGALYLLSNLLFYLQKGWQFEWNSNQTYYAGCVVKDTSDGKMYMCLNNVTSTTAPHSDTTNWKLWDLSMLANYLPLSGGAMTGDSISHVKSNRLISITGRQAGHAGANLNLFGGEDNEIDPNCNGFFQLRAQELANGVTNTSTLNGTPTGQLTWNNNDLGGSAIVASYINSIASHYIKYASGLIYVWGDQYVTGTLTPEILFPISFSDGPRNPKVIAVAHDSDDPTLAYLTTYGITSTKFSCKLSKAVPYISWLAIGY